jgi:predicted dehydrogenase
MSNPNTPAAEIKTVVLGFGLAGRVFHAPFVSAVPGLKLTGIVQRKGDEAAQAYPGTPILRSVEEAFSSDADLIVVGTPNESHFDLAKRALESGKHVVVDKPITGTSAEAETLAKLAAEKGLILAPFHNRRWDGDFLTVRDLLAKGTLGRLVTFESHFDRFRPTPKEGTWKETANLANGLLFDLGPHLVDQAQALFGKPESITASVRQDRDNSGIEDAFDIVLKYPGLLAICRSTMIAADPLPRFLLHGTKGSFKKYGLDPQEPALVAGAKVPPQTDKPDNWLLEKESAWGLLTTAPDTTAPATLVTQKVPAHPGDYRNFYANVRDAIRGTTPLAVTPESAIQTIRLLELARESSESGRTIQIAF